MQREEFLSRLDVANARVASWVAQGIEDGSIAPCNAELAARFVMGAFNWMPRWIGGSGQSMKETTEYFVELLTQTLAPADSKKA